MSPSRRDPNPEPADGTAPASDRHWRELAEKALAGATIESLNWTTRDGIVVPALVTPDNAGQPCPGPAMPRGGAAVRTLIDEPSPPDAARAIAAAIGGGADQVILQFATPHVRGVLLNQADQLATVTDRIALERSALHLRWPALLDDGGDQFLRALGALYLQAGIDPSRRRGGLGLDPVGSAAAGDAPLAEIGDVRPRLARSLEIAVDEFPRFTVLTCSGLAYHEAGATEGQELAAAIATAVHYLRDLDSCGVDIGSAPARIEFELAADCELFLTVAKLRAARLLWARVAESCGLAASAAPIAARTSARMMCAASPHTNLLRTTAAALAAGMGGADAITVLPFDFPSGGADPLARRIARNTQAILRDEGFVGAVADPAAGAYAIEYLTGQLAERAWALFQEIEADGGIVAALESGRLQERIAAARAALARSLEDGQVGLVGVTAYRESDERSRSGRRAPTRPEGAGEAPALRPVRLEELVENDP